MICPMCKGGRKVLKKEKGDMGYIVRLAICDKCNGTGEVEQTNEEWFCSLSTEEKAAFLANYFMFDCPMVDKVFQKQEAHNFIGLEKLAKETILGWLKEKHE